MPESHNEEVLNNPKSRQGILFDKDTGNPGLDRHLQHIRNFDWASTSLGPLESWPPELLQLCHITLLDSGPRLLLLTEERHVFYNESYALMCGTKHPEIIGQTVVQAWGGEVSQSGILGPLNTAEATGRAVHIEEYPLVYERNGFMEEVFLSWMVVPLAGSVDGFYIAVSDVTEANLSGKRRAALKTANALLNNLQNPQDFWQSVPDTLSMETSLIPFSFLYAASDLDVSSESTKDVHFRLAGATGCPQAALPNELTPTQTALFLKVKEPTLLPPRSPSADSILQSDACILCPIRSNRSSKIVAFLFLGINENRPYNEQYQEFVSEIARSLGTVYTTVLLADEEKRKETVRAKEAAKEQQILVTALAARDKEALDATDRYQCMLKVVEMAGVGIFEYDLKGRLVYANDAWYKLVLDDVPKEDLFKTDLSFLNIIFPEDLDFIMSAWNKLSTGEPCTFEMRYRTRNKDGTWIKGGTWIQAACVPVFEDDVVSRISGCTTNIHDTKLREIESHQRIQAIEKAKAWERRFVDFAESAPIGIYFGDISQMLTYCNRAWYDMTGHANVPANETDWTTFVYEEDLPGLQGFYDAVLASPTPLSVQFRTRRRWIDSNGVAIGPTWLTATALPEYEKDGSVKGLIGTILDISALKYAEVMQQMKVAEAVEAKRQQENFIDMVSHEIRNPLGAVIHCSDAASDTLNDMTALVERLNKTSEHGIGPQLQELINNSLDSVSTIVSCSAHQKRIVDDILVLSKLDSNLLQIAPSAVQATTLLRDIMRMFEAEATKHDITLATEIHQSIKDLEVDWTMLDSGRVQQVLINLTTNAMKFVKKRDKRNIIIRMGASKDRPSDALPAIDFVVAHSLHDSVYETPEFAGDMYYLWFSVEDTGKGMNDEEKAKIWNRFTQASPKTYSEYGGSGLGLFISRELSELQGGEIGVASEANVGSTFAFFVKTRHIAAPQQTRAGLPILSRVLTDAAEKGVALTDISVLIVEDNLVNQRVLKKQLAKQGYNVTVADNGQEAVDYIKTTRHWRGKDKPTTHSADRHISVILMDIEMPVMDGLEATQKIRELEADGSLAGPMPIIAVSANARTEQKSQALAAGMDDAVAKPFRIGELCPKINRLANWAWALERSKGVNLQE